MGGVYCVGHLQVGSVGVLTKWDVFYYYYEDCVLIASIEENVDDMHYIHFLNHLPVNRTLKVDFTNKVFRVLV